MEERARERLGEILDVFLREAFPDMLILELLIVQLLIVAEHFQT
jgi:hypothetical protein